MSTSSNPPLVLLTNESGQDTLVNLDQVLVATAVKGGTLIRFTGDKTLEVQQRPADILPLLVKQHLDVAMKAMAASGGGLEALLKAAMAPGK